ncbi:hypothetical protein LX36DRAFT_290862 [Colletotrichum falcatum]|nr:hypothetical protein LX36DRAFT_290862 [Colletotrichum falcatum]
MDAWQAGTRQNERHSHCVCTHAVRGNSLLTTCLCVTATIYVWRIPSYRRQGGGRRRRIWAWSRGILGILGMSRGAVRNSWGERGQVFPPAGGIAASNQNRVTGRDNNPLGAGRPMPCES